MRAKVGEMAGCLPKRDGRLVERTPEGNKHQDAGHGQYDAVEQISTKARSVSGQVRFCCHPRVHGRCRGELSSLGPLRPGPPTVESEGTLRIWIPTLWRHLWRGLRPSVVRNLSVGAVFHEANATDDGCESPLRHPFVTRQMLRTTQQRFHCGTGPRSPGGGAPSADGAFSCQLLPRGDPSPGPAPTPWG